MIVLSKCWRREREGGGDLYVTQKRRGVEQALVKYLGDGKDITKEAGGRKAGKRVGKKRRWWKGFRLIGFKRRVFDLMSR
jgi:hypothetical protein